VLPVALLDWIAIAVLLLSLLIGVVRGLVFELMSLAGWVAAFFVAQWLAEDVGAWLPFGDPAAPWRYAAGFVLVFVAVAFGVGLLAALMRKLVMAAGLRPVDRTLGAAFGIARGAVALLAMAVVVNVMAWRQAPLCQESRAAEILDAALQGLKPALPDKLASYLP
jgi:membrane protein required for colicin V production